MTTGEHSATITDPRVAAFCSPKGPEIFRPVAYPTEIWTPDPLDVETRQLSETQILEIARETRQRH